MLVKFSVENYKSFKDLITIDFTKTHDYSFNSHCIKNGLINKMIIYGPNSCGKSNLGFALFDIVGLLTDKNTDIKQNDPNTFLNADSNLTFATFTYVFKKGPSEIIYSYKKKSPNELIYESFTIDKEIAYAYDFENRQFIINNLQLLNAESLNFDYFEGHLSILRFIANNTSQSEDSIIKFVMKFVSHMLWFRSLQENGYIGLTIGSEPLGEWIAKNNLAKEFQLFLKKLAHIQLDLDKTTVNGPSPVTLLIEKHENKSFVFENVASSGSKALELLFYWSRKFSEVSFLYMDEFDAFYHYDLATNVIQYILEYDNFQAVFTTHNSILASNQLLRPDCYFLLSNGILKSFIDRTERELREGHNLEKLLRNGEFNE